MPLPTVQIHEVGLRDGLQNEAIFVPTEHKLALCELLQDAGVRRIELTSFVSPRWIPQLADHLTMAKDVRKRPNVRYGALVPNLQGLEGALSAGIEDIAVFLSATETHTKKNINKTIAEALQAIGDVVTEAKQHNLRIRGYISTVFGCPYEGDVDPAKVHDLLHQLFAMGIEEVSLGDTIGVANPKQVRECLALFTRDIRVEKLALHMHDTRGIALANVLAGLDQGVRIFDSTFGGLGGCPYAPGASGNLATEDLVYMLEGMNLSTGINLDKIIVASEKISGILGRELPSKTLQAELAKRRKGASKRRAQDGV